MSKALKKEKETKRLLPIAYNGEIFATGHFDKYASPELFKKVKNHWIEYRKTHPNVFPIPEIKEKKKDA